jgi:hypothetical protein
VSTTFSAVIADMDSSVASLERLFGTDHAVHQQRRRLDESKLLEAERFMEGIYSGRVPLYRFQEAMTRSDFPLYYADSLDRQLYGSYTAVDATWKNYVRAATVNDFREVKRYAASGIRGRLSRVKESAEHERRAGSIAEYKYSVNKFEAGFGLSWEAMVNDDLDAFREFPMQLAQSAIDEEEAFVADMLADASGPDANFYTVGNANIVTGNPSLTRPALQAAITQLRKRVDERNNPIQIKAVELVVGPGLELAAQEIVDSTEYRAVGPDGAVTIIRGNGVSANLRTNVNYWLPSIMSTANADTSWWLIANPGESRPGFELGRLRGFEAPALYEKLPDMRRVGGGEVPWSFNHSEAEKKVVHVLGGSPIDPRMSVASKGTNS